MRTKAASGLMLTLLLVGMLTLAFNIQPVRSESGIIYIRADGSIDPLTAPIERNGGIYTFTGNINGSIVVEKDNIVVNGAGYTLQGNGTGAGFILQHRLNVTLKNVRIIHFYTGVALLFSTGNTITGNNVSSNTAGIHLYQSTGNNVSANTVTSNQGGIVVYQGSDYTTVERNTVESNAFEGIDLGMANWCTVAGNSLTNNYIGIWLGHSSNSTFLDNVIRNSFLAMRIEDSHENTFYHNSFIDNTNQIFFIEDNINNVWDDGYPSGGNYWSDYSGTDLYKGPYQNLTGSDGIGDTPYSIDENNNDRYPLIYPYGYVPSPDLNSDGKADGKDIAIVAKAFASYPGHPRWNFQADLNQDSRIEGKDISRVARNFGKTYP